MNVLRLADRKKPVVVYVQPKKGFVDLRTNSDLSALLGELDGQAARRLHADAVASSRRATLRAERVIHRQLALR